MTVHIISVLGPKLTVLVEVMISTESSCASTSISVGCGDDMSSPFSGCAITGENGTFVRSFSVASFSPVMEPDMSSLSKSLSPSVGLAGIMV